MSKSHVTRFSDSSYYDERCILCGGTDASGDHTLNASCPVGHAYIANGHDIHSKDDRIVRCQTCGVEGHDDLSITCTPAVADPVNPCAEQIIRHTPRQGWQDKVAFDLADRTPIASTEIKQPKIVDQAITCDEPYAVEDVMKNFTHATVEVNTPHGKLYGPSDALDYVAELIEYERIRMEVGPQLQITQQGFLPDLTALINSYSIENTSNTADFILAQYLMGCLTAYTRAVILRDGHQNTPESGAAIPPGAADLSGLHDLTDAETHH